MKAFAQAFSSIDEKSIRFLDIFSLTAIGIAHPLQEQLAGNPEFFIVKHSEAIDIIALTLILGLLLPLMFIGLISWAGLIQRKAKRPAFFCVLFLLLMVMTSTALNRVFPMPAVLQLVISSFLAALILFGYLRFRSIRSSFPYIGIAILLVPAFFLSNPSIRKFLVPPNIVRESLPRISSDIPIVMVLWDEFPLVSLLDKENQIDANLYPNLSSLSKNSYWFTNASTISPWTGPAVTTILTGNYPKSDTLPTFYDHPKNLFTMLEGAYTFKVIERQTRLCPTDLCNEQWVKPGFLLRMRRTVEDASAVFLHIVLPQAFEESLPDISKDWADFWMKEEDRHTEFQIFLDSIDRTETPTLFFIHSGLPHAPWTYLPSSEVQKYVLQTMPVAERKNENLLDFQAHLLQVSFVDELIGRLIEKLHRAGLYDRSLILITADHGIGISRKKIDRTITDENLRDIMLVPLFIKLPHQKSGKRMDRNIETVDIVPTIAQILNGETPWSDGASALDLTRPERDHKTVYSGNKILRIGAHVNLNGTLKKELFP